jgi:putative cell wall-binding protein
MNFPNTSILDPDNGPTGFATDDFQFAAIPFGKKYMIIAQGQQLEVVKNRQLAEIRLEQLKNSHRKLTKGTNIPVSQKSQKKAKTPSGQQESQGSKPVASRGSTTKPKSKGVTVKKPHTLHPNPLMDALS